MSIAASGQACPVHTIIARKNKMFLKGYRKEIMNPACNPYFQSVHCIAYLDDDIGGVLPYLNSTLGGDTYIRNPPSLTLRVHGKLVTLHPRKIAVNALKDETEADNILEWLRKEINDAWENRHTIEPKYEGAPKPHLLEIYKLLPKTNCRKCGQPTCMMFSSLAAQGVRGHEDCPALTEEQSEELRLYLGRFKFDAI